MTATPIRAAVCGATGYLGAQCVEILDRHPGVDLVAVHGRSHAGRQFCAAVPGSRVELPILEGFEVGAVDVIFAALPHAIAAGQARRWLSTGAVVVDMSADFRLRDGAAYSRWYGIEHPASDLCDEAVYGLVELERERIPGTDLLAIPGCYPTASLLAALPALRAGIVEAQLLVDAKSGVSGAGRSPSPSLHYGEVNDSLKAYAVEGHRHKAEMIEQLEAAAGSQVRLTFVPHLVPMTRGLLATVYLHPVAGRAVVDVAELMRDLVAGNPFLRYEDVSPATKSVSHSNMAAVNVADQDGVAVVTVAIDNLVKGGAGQAVQAANIRFGLDEIAGLARVSPWP